MKKIIWLVLNILSWLSATHCLQAQGFRRETYGSYGLYSTQEIAPGLGFTTANSFLQTVKEQNNLEKQLFGPLIFGYNFHFGSKISVGFQVSYSRIKTYLNRNTTQEYAGRDAYFTLMPRADYTHFNLDFLRVYSGVAAGVAFLGSKFETAPQTENQRASVSGFAYQINVLGARLGKRFGVYAEVGFGYNGVFTFGISEKF
jgi:hypothetical protein